MKCKNCGAELDDDARFCTECGELIDNAASDDETNEASDQTALLNDEEETTVLPSDGELMDSTDNDEETTVLDEETEAALSELSEDEPAPAVIHAAESPDGAAAPRRHSTLKYDLIKRIRLLTAAVIVLALALIAVVSYSFGNRNYYKKLSKSTITITSQPKDVSVMEGEKTVFEVEADGVNLTYQWYYRKAGEDMWNRWKKHEAPMTEAVANESWNGMQVYCTITDNYRNTISTNIATISVTPAETKAAATSTTAQATKKTEAAKKTEATKKAG